MPASEAMPKLRRWFWPAGAAIFVLVLFASLNFRAYDGFFQDDELDNISWAPYVRAGHYLEGLLTPFFSMDNFRPPGHLYFTLTGAMFQLDFAPYMTPIFVIHLANCCVLFLLLRQLAIDRWQALAGTVFFCVGAGAMDAYWKPMYVFDLCCTFFVLLAVLLWAKRRFVLCFVAYWLAYKSKELAVLLPPVLLAYEYWLGERRYKPLIPFFLTSLSFGVQGIVFNPNKNNGYTFRFTMDALKHTIPFYLERFLCFRYSGLLLFPLAFVRDRRVWFGIFGMLCLVFTLLFLPGRLFTAYAYLPLAFATVAMAACAARVRPMYAVAALLLWMPWNVRQLQRQQEAKLALDDQAFAFVDRIQSWVAANPTIKTLVYDGAPPNFHDWGATAAWNIPHSTLGLKAHFRDTADAAKALREETTAYGSWDYSRKKLSIRIHSPER